MLDNILLALEALKANKMRSLLTMLGIIIGISSVIGIVTVGESLTASVNSTMNDAGVNQLTISVTQKETEDENTQLFLSNDLQVEDYISDKNIQEYQKLFVDEVKGVSASEKVNSLTTRSDLETLSLSTTGINLGYQQSNSFDLLYGRGFTQDDLDKEKKLAVIEEDLAIELFGNTDPIGQALNIYNQNLIEQYYVVGISESNDDQMMMFSSGDTYNVYIPITTAKEMNGSEDGYSSIAVTFSDSTDIDLMKTLTTDFFTDVYSRNDQYTVRVSDPSSMLESFTDMLGTIQIAIAAIAAISLLVGGIGVMNIMLVSITERTKEIGTRKALGAPTFDIMSQFVTEAIIICMIGGIFGVIIGVALGMGAAALLGFPAYPSVISIVLAVGFSMTIGLFFGYYPAKKAAKLDPIEALRYE